MKVFILGALVELIGLKLIGAFTGLRSMLSF